MRRPLPRPRRDSVEVRLADVLEIVDALDMYLLKMDGLDVLINCGVEFGIIPEGVGALVADLRDHLEEIDKALNKLFEKMRKAAM